MRDILTLLLLLLSAQVTQAQERLLLSGTLSEEIVILNRSTEEIEWRYSERNGECKECNSLLYLDGGRVAYTHKKGARVINLQGETIWEFKVEQGEELQSISRGRDGFILAIAGTPIRVVELDMEFNIRGETLFDCGVESIRKQFRQIAVTQSGNYIVPIAPSRRVVELTPEGEVVKDISLTESPLYVLTTKGGDWIATCGHSGVIYKIDGESGEVSEIVSGKRLNNGANIEFVAAITELDSGNLLLTNWVGHNGDRSQPILIEINHKGEVLWQMNRLEDFTFISGVDIVR